MEYLAIGLFILAVVGIPIFVLLRNDYGSKRGCGRGCATCGNRDICHRNQYKNKENKS